MLHLKRKIADLSDWTPNFQKQYDQMTVDEPNFHGIVTMVSFKHVEEKATYQIGVKPRYYTVNNGYVWLQYFPNGLGYAITTVLNEADELVHHYIDIHTGNELTAEGVPFFYDLFLDLVVLPSGERYIMDEQELRAALDKQVITKEQFNIAYRILEELLHDLKEGSLPLDRWQQDLAQFRVGKR